MKKKLLQICIVIIMSVIFTSCSSEDKREAESVIVVN